MDTIITPRRLEETFPAFQVHSQHQGLSFLRYNHSFSFASSDEEEEVEEGGGGKRRRQKKKRGEVLYLPGLDGSGCTLGPQVRLFSFWAGGWVGG